MHSYDIRMLYEYNCWANQRILGAAAGVSDAQFVSARLGYCRLRDTLVHIFSAERRWRLRWQGVPDTSMVDPEQVLTLSALRELWEAEQPQMQAYLGTLPDDEFAEVFSYQRSNGSVMTSTRWAALAHMVNHGTQHRAELALLLTELGHSPGNMDLNVFIAANVG